MDCDAAVQRFADPRMFLVDPISITFCIYICILRVNTNLCHNFSFIFLIDLDYCKHPSVAQNRDDFQKYTM